MTEKHTESDPLSPPTEPFEICSQSVSSTPVFDDIGTEIQPDEHLSESEILVEDDWLDPAPADVPLVDWMAAGNASLEHTQRIQASDSPMMSIEDRPPMQPLPCCADGAEILGEPNSDYPDKPNKQPPLSLSLHDANRRVGDVELARSILEAIEGSDGQVDPAPAADLVSALDVPMQPTLVEAPSEPPLPKSNATFSILRERRMSSLIADLTSHPIPEQDLIYDYASENDRLLLSDDAEQIFVSDTVSTGGTKARFSVLEKWPDCDPLGLAKWFGVLIATAGVAILLSAVLEWN